MRVLGITTEGDGGAAIVEDGRILASVNEERLCRMKLVVGFPRESIREVMRLTGTRVQDLDEVIVAATSTTFVDELEPFDGWFQGLHTGSNGWIKRAAGKLAKYGDSLPFTERGYYLLQSPNFFRRRQAIRRILRTEFDIPLPVRFVDHHLAHLTSAFYTSGFDDALVVSIDGGGDGRSSLIYAVRDGRWEYVHETSSFHSLGNYYAYVTHICGFKAQKHEGKITGLAAHGEPKYVPLLQKFIDEQDGLLRNYGKVVFGGAIQELQRQLPRGWTREDLAASIQVHTEEVVKRYVSHWCHRTGLRNVALAGGVFANVRVNEEVHRLPDVDRIFVHPHMGDGGLSVGAALAACMPGVTSKTMPASSTPLQDVYLGPPLSTSSIDEALRKHGLSPEVIDGSLEERIADLLVSGYVVARADGRMEYGPRALGNRSILYQPTDPSVNNWLNTNLRRTEFMPFAPSLVFEARDQCFENIQGAEHAAEFMTITFHCTPWMRRHMAGVVHIDGTARPQLVREDRNPGYYRILREFQARTGLPGVINTSFNMHEEPIVCSADDAVRAFLDGNLDYLALGPLLIEHPGKVTHPLNGVVDAHGTAVV